MKQTQTDSALLDSAAQRELIDGHMHMVRSLARQVKAATRTRQPIEELESMGTLGLIESAQRYRTGGPASFKTYAYYRVRGSIYDGIAEAAPLPRSVYRRQRENARAGHFVKLFGGTQCPHAANTPGADEQLFHCERSSLLEDALAALPAKNRRLLRSMYYGESSLTEAASELGLSKSWSCRVHQKSLELLRRRISSVSDGESLASFSD